MTYKIFLKNNCKAEIRSSYPRSIFSLFIMTLCLSSLGVFCGYIILAQNQFGTKERSIDKSVALEVETINTPIPNKKIKDIETSKLSPSKTKKEIENTANISWKSIIIKPGDSLALIFSKLGLSAKSLHEIMLIGKKTSILKKLSPGKKINFHIIDNELIALNYEINLVKILEVSKYDNKYIAKEIDIKLDSTVKNANGVIKESLFLSGEKAGLSDNLIMQLVTIFGWDIDFALDIREGDSFAVLYEEQYKEGVMVAEGPIIAAEFINRGKIIKAVRYLDSTGQNNYYNSNGEAMKKAFLRTPIDFFSRISSKFSLKRKHPVLNKIRAHKGVDYAAPIGTPIKATGDGVVNYVGKNGGYGNTIKLKHGGAYTTLYAHLQRFAKNMRRGEKVKQGQIIGYVGTTGLSTGPHLHYEFQIHGVHRNPLTVQLPKVRVIDRKNIAEFKKTIAPILAELDLIKGKNVLSAKYTKTITKEIKLDDG